MLINGVDTEKLTLVVRPELVRPVIPGRTLQLDGDFVAYFVSAANDVSIEDMFKNADTIIKRLKEAAGAEHCVVHLTPHGSTKGGRYNICRLKKYQANREGKAKPEFLEHVRIHLAENCNGKLWEDLEADDGMSMYQHACVEAGHPELSVICSKDKDLRIVQGYHLDWDTLELVNTDFFGEIHMEAKKSGSKLVGSGFKFFCAQMLMGDPADNVSGIPGVFRDGKIKKCGPVMAYSIVSKTRTPKEAIAAIVREYAMYSNAQGFVSYTGEDLSWDEAFFSEAKLLWMRRFPDENDIESLIKEIMHEDN